MRIYMTHIAEQARPPRRPDLFVCGHSHLVRVFRDSKSGLLYMNPGAAGHVGWHKMRTLIRFALNEGKVESPELIELGPRGRKSAPGT